MTATTPTTPITTTTANVTRAGDLHAALESALAALTRFDADKLEEIEGKVSAFLAGNDPRTLFPADDAERLTNLDQILANHRLLGTLLASTSLNLNVLQRLHNRNSLGETSWVR